MNKAIELLLPILVVSLLFSTPLVHAEEDEEPIVVQPIINIDLQGVIDAITGTGNNLETNVNEVPNGIFGLFTGWFDDSLQEFDVTLLSLTGFLLATNPDPESMFDWWQSIVLIISSFYLLIFLLVGFMFMYHSINPEKRAVAKEWFKNTFLMIIGVNVSFWLYQLILELSTAITQFLWITGFENFFEESILAGAGTIHLTFYLFAIGLTLLTLFIRYLFLLLSVMIFPIGIFLYFIPPLKNWGQMIFNLIGIVLAMQFIDVIIFVTANQVMFNLAGQEGATLVPALSFFLIGLMNIALFFYAITKSVFSATENSKTISFLAGAITGQIGSLINAVKPSESDSK